MEENEALKYVKSKDVRAYIERTGLRFSDSEIGTLLFHSGMPYHELHRALKELAEKTADQELRRQIGERIAYDDRALGSKYEQQLQKLFQCLEGQQKQLSLLIAGMEQVEESCCRLEDGLLEKESWSEESEGAIV